ncbi:unnamed protein product, partial [Ostreobium quekettii]
VIDTYHEVQRAFAPKIKDAPPPQHNKKEYGQKGGVNASEMMAELVSKSKYQAEVAADTVKYREVVTDLIKRVTAFKAENMDELRRFLNEADEHLDRLTDESAVLKSFPWPATRFDAFREGVGLDDELEAMKRKMREWPPLGKLRQQGLKKIIDYA